MRVAPQMPPQIPRPGAATDCTASFKTLRQTEHFNLMSTLFSNLSSSYPPNESALAIFLRNRAKEMFAKRLILLLERHKFHRHCLLRILLFE